MRELPIPFTAAMVRAVRKGTKTQTRRLRMLCRPGDRLWVREAWRATLIWDKVPPREITPGSLIHYEADGPADPTLFGKLRPPMFMPRWMCRTVLDVSEVRGHQLAIITDEEILAEGIERIGDTGPGAGPNRFSVVDVGYTNFPTATEAFTYLWDSINGRKAPVSSNPFVWAHTFREVKP